MCDECARLQGLYAETAAVFVNAQFELARYRHPNSEIAFTESWGSSVTALRTLWSLREEMARRTPVHSETYMSACA